MLQDPSAKLIRELREELERLRSQVGGGSQVQGDGAELTALKDKLKETEE